MHLSSDPQTEVFMWAFSSCYLNKSLPLILGRGYVRGNMDVIIKVVYSSCENS